MNLKLIVTLCTVAFMSAAYCNNVDSKTCAKTSTQCSCKAGGECACKEACACAEQTKCATCACTDKAACAEGKCTKCAPADKAACCKKGEACAKSNNSACTKQGKCAKDGKCAMKNQPIKKVIVAHFDVKADKVKDFVKVAQAAITATRQEPGCISYTLLQVPTDPTNFIMYEEWKDQAAIDFHFAQPHLVEFGKLNTPMMANPTKLQIFDISAEK